MYIEQMLARVIKYAAAIGEIPYLDPEEVLTDMTAANEWQGRAKVYIIREETSVFNDLSDAWDGPGAAESAVTIAAIGADKRQALETINGTMAALRSYFSFGPTGQAESEGESVIISADETAEISVLETLTTWTLTADGEISGDGWITAKTATGIFSPTMTAYPIDSWAMTAANGLERFDNGAFREQYYQTRKFKAIHQI